LISLQNGLDAFKSPTSTWEVDAITYRNDVKGLIKLFNDNRGRTFQQSAKVKFREMENSK
jgi:hypothetical protein